MTSEEFKNAYRLALEESAKQDAIDARTRFIEWLAKRESKAKDMTKEEFDAYNAGYHDYLSGKTRDDNPHQVNSVEYKNWNTGWDDALVDCLETNEEL